MTRVYLSGPITGLPEPEYTRSFARAEQHYRTAGYEVVNPVELGKGPAPEESGCQLRGLHVGRLGSLAWLHSHCLARRLGEFQRRGKGKSRSRTART